MVSRLSPPKPIASAPPIGSCIFSRFVMNFMMATEKTGYFGKKQWFRTHVITQENSAPDGPSRLGVAQLAKVDRSSAP